MQLYSLLDKKGCEAREAFDYKTGSWSIADERHAERVQGWAKSKGLDLSIETSAHHRVALHCPAAGKYWHPDGQSLQYYLNEVRLLLDHIAGHETLSGQLKASTRKLDVRSISLLFDQLHEYFSNDYGDEPEAFVKAIAIARDALGRLGKC